MIKTLMKQLYFRDLRRRRLARARRDRDQTAFNWGRGKSFLIGIRGMSGSFLKKRFKVALQPRHHR